MRTPVTPETLRHLNDKFISRENRKMLERRSDEMNMFCRDVFGAPDNYTMMTSNDSGLTLLDFMAKQTKEELLILLKKCCANEEMDWGKITAGKEDFLSTIENWDSDKTTLVDKKRFVLFLIQKETSPLKSFLPNNPALPPECAFEKMQLNLADKWFQAANPGKPLESFQHYQRYHSQNTQQVTIIYTASPDIKLEDNRSPKALVDGLTTLTLRQDASTVQHKFFGNEENKFEHHHSARLQLNAPIPGFLAVDVTTPEEALQLTRLEYDNPKLAEVMNDRRIDMEPTPQEFQRFYSFLHNTIQSTQPTIPAATDPNAPLITMARQINISALMAYATHNSLQPNLSGMDCQNADLQNANLQNANLQSANLAGADLRGANVQGANFKLVQVDLHTEIDDLQFQPLANSSDPAIQNLKKSLIDRLQQYITGRDKRDDKGQFSPGFFCWDKALRLEKVIAAKQLILQVAAASDIDEIARALKDQKADSRISSNGKYEKCLRNCITMHRECVESLRVVPPQAEPRAP